MQDIPTNNIDTKEKETKEESSAVELSAEAKKVVYKKVNIGQILLFCSIALFIAACAILVISELIEPSTDIQGITMFTLAFWVILPTSVVAMIATSIVSIVMSKHCVKLRGSLFGKICLYLSSMVALGLFLLYTVILLITNL